MAQKRQQIVSKAVKAHPARQPTGGTQAPRAAAQGQRTGIGQQRQAYKPQIGVGPGKPAKGPLGGQIGANVGSTIQTPRAPTPWDSRYEQRVSAANRNYLSAENDLNLAETGVKADYGFDYKGNPNSRAALLEEKFKEGNRGIGNMAGYQLYSGATGNRRFENRRGYGIDKDRLEQEYRGALKDIADRRLVAAEEKGGEETDAYWDKISKAEESEPDASQAPVPPGKKKKKPKKKGKR